MYLYRSKCVFHLEQRDEPSHRENWKLLNLFRRPALFNNRYKLSYIPLLQYRVQPVRPLYVAHVRSTP